MPVLRAGLCLGVLAATAIVAGCGGGGELSRDEFIARADALCEAGRKTFAELQDRPPRDTDAAARVTAELIEALQDELDELGGLDPPRDLAEPMERYLAERERALELLRAGREAAADGDTGAYLAAQREVTGASPERLRLARGIGLERCSRPEHGR